MINLKMSKKEAKERNKEIAVDEEAYPWGTRLSFEKELIAKIKALKEAEAGDVVRIHATGFVSEVSKTDSKGGNNYRSVSIQLKEISIDDNSNGPGAAKREFNKDD